MKTEDRKTRLVSIALMVLVVLSLLYNTVAHQWVQSQWEYFKRRLAFERTVKKTGLPMHPARFWRQVE